MLQSCTTALLLLISSFMILQVFSAEEKNPRNEFNFLDFRAYVLKPFKIDYNKIYPERKEEPQPQAAALVASDYTKYVTPNLALSQSVPVNRPPAQPLKLGFNYFTDYFKNLSIRSAPFTRQLPIQVAKSKTQSSEPLKPTHVNQRYKKTDSQHLNKKRMLVDHVLYHVDSKESEGVKQKSPKIFIPHPKKVEKDDKVIKEEPIFDSVQNKSSLKIIYDLTEEPYSTKSSEDTQRADASEKNEEVLESPPEENSAPAEVQQYFQ